MHVRDVQKYCFSLSNMQICGVFCCRRRNSCLSSLLFHRGRLRIVSKLKEARAERAEFADVTVVFIKYADL